VAGKNSNASGWGTKLKAVLLSLVVVVVLFAMSFSSNGNDTQAIVRAAIPLLAGVLVAFLLGSIDKLAPRRWQIYIFVLLAVAIYIALKIYRIL